MPAKRKSVFINCPFDEKYYDKLSIIIFIIEFFGFEALVSNSDTIGEERISNIINLISTSKYSIHDLSRNKSSNKNEFARFNMPLELGIDIGVNISKKLNKKILVLDNKPHQYDKYISDLSGRDIEYHSNKNDALFWILPQWFSSIEKKKYYQDGKLRGFYKLFEIEYKTTHKNTGALIRDIKKVKKINYIYHVRHWVKTFLKEQKLKPYI